MTIGDHPTRIARTQASSLSQLDESYRYRLLVEGVLDYALYLLDADGYVSSWNTGAQRFKGYRAEEIIGQHFSCFYTPEDRAAGVPQHALETAPDKGTSNPKAGACARTARASGPAPSSTPSATMPGY